MYIYLVLFKENIYIFNLGHVIYTFKHQHFNTKRTFMGVFPALLCRWLALYSTVEVLRLFGFFALCIRCSWSSAGLWERTSSRNSMRASIGTVLVSLSYFVPREGMLDSC